jgi:menaquinone-9 beta-reductase
MARIVIIGAGPAGSTAAIVLARRGWEVHLIEQHRFPRRKVCGECISPLGIDVLVRLGVQSALRRVGHVRLTRSAFVGTDGRETSTTLPREMWGVSRPALDSVLLEAAREAQVTVHQPGRVEGVYRRNVLMRDLESNHIQKIRCRQIVLSDGKAALGADRPARSIDLGMQAHFQAVDDQADCISLFSLPGHYCGLAPVESGEWNVAMSIPAHHVRRRKLDEIWQQVLSQNAGLKRRMRRARQVTPWLAAPLPRFTVQSRWVDGTLPIGNAAAALEPIGGEGMGLAMRSAEIGAEAIDAALRERRAVDVERLRSQFRRLWRWRSIVCRVGGMIASHPRLAGWAISVLSLDERLGRTLVGLTGKTTVCR